MRARRCEMKFRSAGNDVFQNRTGEGALLRNATKKRLSEGMERGLPISINFIVAAQAEAEHGINRDKMAKNWTALTDCPKANQKTPLSRNTRGWCAVLQKNPEQGVKLKMRKMLKKEPRLWSPKYTRDSVSAWRIAASTRRAWHRPGPARDFRRNHYTLYINLGIIRFVKSWRFL